MARNHGPEVTVHLRRVATGHKEAEFTAEMSAAYRMAEILIRSHEFAHCFAVGVNGAGQQMFVVGQAPMAMPQHVPAPQPYSQTYPGYGNPQTAQYYPQALPAYQPPPQPPPYQNYPQPAYPAYPPPYQNHPALPAPQTRPAVPHGTNDVIYDAEFEE